MISVFIDTFVILNLDRICSPDNGCDASSGKDGTKR